MRFHKDDCRKVMTECQDFIAIQQFRHAYVMMMKRYSSFIDNFVTDPGVIRTKPYKRLDLKSSHFLCDGNMMSWWRKGTVASKSFCHDGLLTLS